MARGFAFFVAIALGLAGCAPETPQSAPATDALAPAPPAELALAPLTFPLTEGALDGELGCTFRDAGGAMLVSALGYVASNEPSTAVARTGAVTHALRSTTRPGYDGMVEGATFANDAISVEVRIGAPLPDTGEQVGHAATASVTMGAATRAYDGVWMCGP